MIRPLAGFVALLALAFLVGGCGQEARSLARVGKSTVTVGDYYDRAAGLEGQYPPLPDSAKAQFLRDMIHRRLMVLEAHNRGLFDDTLVVHYRELKEKELLLQSLGAELAPASVPVSEAEARTLYAARDSTTHVQLIYAFSEVAARSAAELARSGQNFAEIADRFNPPSVLPPGGDIGEQLAGNMVSPLDGYIRHAAPGSIIGPLEAPAQGWFVLRILSRRANPQPPYEVVRDQLMGMLRQRKQRAVVTARVKRLRQAYAVEVLPGGAQTIFRHFNVPSDQSPAPVDAEQRSRPLARWRQEDGEHVYTFGDALVDLQNASRDRPDTAVLPAIEQWILVSILQRVQEAEARRRGIALDPKWRTRLDETVNSYVVDALYQTEVLTAVSAAGPGDAQAAYLRDPRRFERLTSARLEVIEFPDSTAAFGFAGHAGHAAPGASLRAIAAMVPGAPPVRDLDLSFPSTDPEWKMFEPTLLAMSKGDGMGPLLSHGRWIVARLADKQQGAPPFESLDPNVRGVLEQEAVEIARERRFLAFMDELKRFFPVTIDQALLKKLPWPVTRGS